jgi:hypothetical protein
MSVLVKDLPVESKIHWRIGTPTKYGNYLVFCNTPHGLCIRRDIWFDDGRGWQSKWHDMIAWCAFEDIILEEKKK